MKVKIESVKIDGRDFNPDCVYLTDGEAGAISTLNKAVLSDLSHW